MDRSINVMDLVYGPRYSRRVRCSVLPPLCFPSPPESKGGSRAIGLLLPPVGRWNNSAGAGLVRAFDSRRAVCELLASYNTQILACFPHQLD